MAHCNHAVFLGYDDEFITENHKRNINFTTNKIGGKPDWPSTVTLENPQCPLCQLPRPLLLQIYAPLDNVAFHRTLYIFACINPNCWNHSESWTCIRIQTLEQVVQSVVAEPSPVVTKTSDGFKEWCQDADDWGEDDSNANLGEENGNLISNSEKVSDEDDESCSFDESLRQGLGNLTVDDRNANIGVTPPEAQGGAVGRLHSPSATAEIEGDEGEVISIDTPTMPQHDIVALLQEVTPLPQELCQKAKCDVLRSSALQFLNYFISVGEESGNANNVSDRHVRELLQEYQQNSDDFINVVEIDGGGGAASNEVIPEKYEKGIPAHGDKMFHHFLSKIQMNPGQILRYCRDGSTPLLLYPLQEVPRKCSYCQGEMVFELQVLPTLIPKLQLVTDPKAITRVEFGNVLIFTCKKSCWITEADFREEAVVVQTEIY